MRGRLASTVATITAIALLWAAPAPATRAKTPPPPASLASSTIDAHLGYMPQRTCSPSAKPGTAALLKLLIATWGGSSSGISRGCGVGTTSEHKEGRALDWRRDVKYASHRRSVNAALDWLTANNGEVAYRLGVMYIIWNQHIWSLYYPELGWRKMASRGSYTANHKNHVHISLSWDGAMKQTSWWTGVPVAAPLNSKCGVGGAPACLPTIARNGKLSWPYQHTDVPASFLPAPWTVPGIGGSPQVGRTLTAVAGTWVPEGAQVGYQWVAGSADIAGATAKTFEVTAAQVGRPIRVRVTATTADGTAVRVSTASNDVVKARFSTIPTPKLTGTVATGQPVTVDPGEWAATPDTLTVTWKRNGKAIKGASGVGLTTYTPTSADAGKKLTATVTGRRAGFYPASATSPAVKVAKGTFTAAPTPTIAGDAVVGSTLTANLDTWQPDATLRYRWYAAGRAVKGATKPTFVVPSSLAGTDVLVQVTATRPGYATATATSDPVTINAG
jgi:hypothetical protein